MLWIDPDVYTLKDLLTVYPKAQLVSAREKRAIAYEEVAEAAQREYGLPQRLKMSGGTLSTYAILMETLYRFQQVK